MAESWRIGGGGTRCTIGTVAAGPPDEAVSEEDEGGERDLCLGGAEVTSLLDELVCCW